LPRKPTDSMISLTRALHLLLMSLVIAFGTLVAGYFGMRSSQALAQTMVFTSLVVLELIAVQIIRSIYNVGVFSNPLVIVAVAISFVLQLLIVYTPFLQRVLHTVPLSLKEWGGIAVIAVVVWALCQFMNRIFKKQFLEAK